MNKILTILLLGLLSLSTKAQPHIDGEIEIDMKSGLIKCDFTLSQLPEIEDYSLLLNKGMNIKSFKDSKNNIVDYSGHYDSKTRGEAIEYQLLDVGDLLPSKFNVEYIGAFPTYKDEYSTFDYKGIIAFNENTLRATEQTKWYPVIYDVANDKLINSYTYDLRVTINNGNTVFVNGSIPKKGHVSTFKSNKPYPLLIFAGTYNFIESNEDYILNSNITEENAKAVFNNIEIIKKHLSSSLEKKFSDRIFLINHKSLNKRKKGSSWGFNTYPTFAFTGLDFNELVDEEGKFSKNNFKYFGHEFGHNYFGNNVMSGKLSWFWLESFPEYLSYKIAEDICGKDFLKSILLREIKNLKTEEFIPLDKITNKNEINENYRYSLGPLLLQCFEEKFGRDVTNNVLKFLLKSSEEETLTINHLKTAAIQSDIPILEFSKFEKHFISNKNFKENIITEIEKKCNN